ncbi:MAG: potassium transporter TrkH [Elusimicrobia bacterium]|nr:potassium transporter TrkH [Elusimicrobiota bacterium]
MLRHIETAMSVLGLSVMAALVAEYGFGWAPAASGAAHAAEFAAAYLFCALQALKLFAVPSALRYLARNWLDFTLVFLMLFQLAAGFGVQGSAEYQYLLDEGSKLPLASISLVFVQCYFLAVAVLESPLLHRLLLRLKLSPAPLLAASFLLLIAGGTLLLKLPRAAAHGAELSWVDALFTAASAACVTGLTTVDPGSSFSALGQFALLCLIQLGGLGILSFTAFIAIFSGESLSEAAPLKELFDADNLAELRTFILRLVGVAFLAEAAGAALLYQALAPQVADPFLRFFHALFHSVSAFCNAGFSLYRDNMHSLRGDLTAMSTLMALMLAGAIGYPILVYLPRTLSRAARGKFSKVSAHIKTVLAANFILIAGGGLLFLLCENGGLLSGMSLRQRLLAALFMPVTARTTGFQIFDLGGLGLFSVIVLITLMFIGGAPASAAGGLKVTGAAALWARFRSLFTGSREMSVFGERLGSGVVSKAALIAALLAVSALSASVLVWLLEPVTYAQALFEAVSAVCTVGLSMGITSSLSAASKLVLIACMFLGRVGPVLVVLLYNSGHEQKDEAVILG